MIQIKQLREDLEDCAEQHKEIGTSDFLTGLSQSSTGGAP